MPAGSIDNFTPPSYSPLYKQIKNLLLSQLQSGEWKPGEVIPSEIDLANRFGVSQGTVRKAIDELAAEYFLVRKQGKGTFVGCHDDDVSPLRFLRLVPKTGEPKPWRRHFIDCEDLSAPKEVAQALKLEPKAKVLKIRRLLISEAKPIVYDRIWLPYEKFSSLTSERLSQYCGHMYVLFESDCGVRMLRADEQVSAIAAPKDAAELLKIPEQTPILQVLRTSYTYGDLPVEYRCGYYSTHTHHYQNELV